VGRERVYGARPVTGHHREGSGEPLVLLHGGGSTWREFGPMLPILTGERDVIAMKAPGHHDGPPLPEGSSITVPDFADAFELELDALGLERVDVAGHSFGGWQALELARRGRARSVVAIAPTGGWSQEDAARTEQMFAEGFIPGARRWRPVVSTVVRTRKGRSMLFAGAGTEGRRVSPADAAAFFTALAEWQLAPRLHEFLADPDGRYRTADRLPEIGCPVLLIWGTEDTVVPIHQARHFLDRLPDAELRELEGTGHFPQFDEPDRIARAILEFTGKSEGLH
jgi:pimeloyl-ACP methyl ester carboxylesterase